MFMGRIVYTFIIDYTKGDTASITQCDNIDEANTIIDSRMEELKDNPIFNNKLVKHIDFNTRNISVLNILDLAKFGAKSVRKTIIYTITVSISDVLIDKTKTDSSCNTLTFGEMLINSGKLVYGYKVFNVNGVILITNGLGKIYEVCKADDITESVTLTDFVRMLMCHMCEYNKKSSLVSQPIILSNK